MVKPYHTWHGYQIATAGQSCSIVERLPSPGICSMHGRCQTPCSTSNECWRMPFAHPLRVSYGRVVGGGIIAIYEICAIA